jgi:hypothetical protein
LFLRWHDAEHTDEFELWWLRLLLIGGDKTGNDLWYAEFVPVAYRLYDEHLRILAREEEAGDGEEVS